MNVWQCDNWKKIINTNSPYYRDGLRLNFQNSIDPEVRRACIEFSKWLRTEFVFPVRIQVYFKASEYVRTRSGELVSAKFFGPFDKMVEPYASVATGDFIERERKHGKDEALAAVLGSLIHELTHYFQWVNDIELTEDQSERQAIYYRNKIIQEYAQTREHP